MLPYHYEPGVQPNVEAQRAPLPATIDASLLPSTFPTYQWTYQYARYKEYWDWFSGANLAVKVGTDEQNKPIYKFPLRINVIRNTARKHAAILLGEETFDAPEPLVKTLATPKLPLTGENASESDKKMAQGFQNLVNEVWNSSGGRALQVENATLSQFLGGCFFQLKWEPKRTDLLIPITIHAPAPDFVLPIWSTTDYFRLLECYIVYRISAHTAAKDYGYKAASDTAPVYYCEYWSETHYSIMINNTPLVIDGVTYANLPNPFGFVPIVYIPHLKEGHWYGSSHVDDLRGLILEYNARMADTGDIVRNNAKVSRYMRNVRNPKNKQITPGIWATDMGDENPAQKHPPEIYHEDPPAVSPSLMEYPQKSLHLEILRESYLSDVAYGEDEGSQRSALTLYFRMWPTTSHVRMERAFWREGLVRLATMIGRMVTTKRTALKAMGVDVSWLTDDFMRRLNVGIDWKPMLPQDREQMVNEMTLLASVDMVSPETGIEKMGHTRNTQEEIERIYAHKEKAGEIEAAVDVQQPKATAFGE